MSNNKRYTCLHRNKFITLYANSIDDFIETYERYAAMFREWKEKGVKLDPDSGIGDDYASFYTENEQVATELEFEYEDFDEDYEEEYEEEEVPCCKKTNCHCFEEDED